MSCQIPRDLPNIRWRAKISRWSASRSSQRGVVFRWQFFAPLGLLASRRPQAYLYTRGFLRPRGDSAAFHYAEPEGRGHAGTCTPLGVERWGHSVLLRCRLSLYPGACGPMYQRRRRGRIVPSPVALTCTSRGLCASFYAPLLCARGRRLYRRRRLKDRMPWLLQVRLMLRRSARHM